MSAGKADVSLAINSRRKKVFEVTDDFLGGSAKPRQFQQEVPLQLGDFIDRYSNLQSGGQISFERGDSASFRHEAEPKKGIITFEKVGEETLDKRERHPGRKPSFAINHHPISNRCNDMKSSVSILPGGVVNDFQVGSEPAIRIIDRFFSAVKLYASEPRVQLIWKLELVETCTVELFREGVDRELNAICVGGRFPTLTDPNCFPYQRIKGGSELVEKLAQFEREQIIAQDSGVFENRPSDPCPITFLIKPDSVSAIWKQPFDFSVQRFEMYFGPLKSLPAIFK